MTKIFVIFVGIILMGCSTIKNNQQKENRHSYQYSKETENVFNAIETQNSPLDEEAKNAALRYQRMREQTWEDYLKEGPDRTESRPEINQRQNSTRETFAPKNDFSIPTSEKMKELEIQSGQMMDYFCMKNRNRGNFGDKEYCEEYTEKILETCKSKNNGYLSTSVVRCLKSKLNV